jgi:hypothetical protein
MEPLTARRATLWLALAILGTCACPQGPPPCPTPVDCELPQCAGEPECTENGQVEDCENGIDDDGDGLIDDQDRDCKEGIAPSDGTDCVGQNTTTTAGADTDVFFDDADCEDPVGSDSGDGDTVDVVITESNGVADVEIAIAENGTGSSPTATVEIKTQTTVEPSGRWSLLSVVDLSADTGASIETTCEALGYTISIIGSGREFIPVLPLGSTYDCTTSISVTGDGSATSRFRILVGAGLADDTDGDGKSNRNDLCNGCPQEGTFGPGGAYQYACRRPDLHPCVFSPDPTPEFCIDCLMGFGSVIASVGPDGSLSFGSSGIVEIDDGRLGDEFDGWYVEGVFIRYEPESAVVQLTSGQGGGEFDGWYVEGEYIACTNGCQSIASRQALDGGDPKVAELRLETGDPAVDGQFTVEVSVDGRPSEDLTVATTGGEGEGPVVVLFDDTATAEPLQASGFAPPTDDCPGEAPIATFTESFACTITYTPLDFGDRIELPQSGIETVNSVASNFADLGLGELFSVSGASGVGIYRADNFSLVPSLSRLTGVTRLMNVLGSLHLGLAGFPNDGHFYFTTPFGTGITHYYPEISGFGATLVSNIAVRDATYVDGDPNDGRGVYATATFLSGLSFQNLGAPEPFLTSNPLYSGAPAGYSITSAFQTSTSNNVLFAARSTTAGGNGGLFLRTGPTTSVAVGTLGVDPRLLRCASATAGTWICVATNYESSNATIITWDGAANAAVAGTITTGPNPLVPGIDAEGGEVHTLIPSFTGDSVLAVRLDGTTGAEIARKTYALPPGVAVSSALILEDGSTGVATLSGSDELQIIRETFTF